MFNFWFPKGWSTLKKMIWLKAMGIAQSLWSTITGNPVSFSAIAAPLKQLSVALSPVQDLHGYDSPWPAGGGKNKLYSLETSYTFPADASTRHSIGTVNVVSGNTYVISYYQNTTMGSNSRNTLSVFYDNAEHYEYAAANRRLSSGRYSWTYTAQTTGEVTIKLWLNAPDVAVTCDRFMVNEGNTLEDYSPYSNICPISGWDGVTVWRTGKNLYSGDKLANASISASGTLENNNNNDVLIARVFEGESYTFSLNPEGVTVAGLFNEYPTMDSVTYNNARLYMSGTESYTYTIPQGVKYIGVRYLKTFTEYQLVMGNELPDTYAPYTGRSISISFGSTVYSGTVDVLTGVVTVTHGFTTIDGNSTVNPNGATAITSRFITTISGKANGASNFTSNLFHYAAVGDAVGIATGRASNNLIEFMLPISVTQTANAGKAWFADNPTQVCYELATPIPIQLTPQEVESLAGDNTMWSDANGDLTVEYRSN